MLAESLVIDGMGSHTAAPHAPALSNLTQLLHDISGNNQAALRALYEATSAKLYGLARAMLGNAADAEDARLLGVAEGAPLLLCERITLSERREPVEYCVMKYVSSYRYSTRIAKTSGMS